MLKGTGGSNPSLSAISILYSFCHVEKYPSGRRGSPAKGVGWVNRRESSNLSFSAKSPSHMDLRRAFHFLFLFHKVALMLFITRYTTRLLSTKAGAFAPASSGLIVILRGVQRRTLYDAQRDHHGQQLVHHAVDDRDDIAFTGSVTRRSPRAARSH